nr:MAG TPA: terminase small subunit [Caudoviricetes sp.]
MHTGRNARKIWSEVVNRVAKGKYQKWLTPDGHTLLEAWARDGLTDEQIAHNMGIRRSTLADWKTKYTDISDALKKGKEVVDVEVENALLKRAKGFEFTETKIEQSPKDGRKVTIIKRLVPPETAAAIFWLKNRKPEQWREKQVEQGGPLDAEDDPITKSLKEDFSK